MKLPEEVQKYKNEQMAFYGQNKVRTKIKASWDNYIVPANLYSLGEDGAYAYLKKRPSLNERNLGVTEK